MISPHTKIILLGTGTPNADPDRSGPSVAIVVDQTPYIVDFGPGVVRRAAAAGLPMKELKEAALLSKRVYNISSRPSNERAQESILNPFTFRPHCRVS